MAKEPFFSYLTRKLYYIDIQNDRDVLIGHFGLSMLKDRYLWGKDETPQQLFARVSCSVADSQEMAEKIYNYMSSLWFMPATPILSNIGTRRGMPISCFLNQVDDSRKGIKETWYESASMSSIGGGVGTDFSKLRSLGSNTSTGNKTSGLIAFLRLFDSLPDAFMQGATRRGAVAAYVDISHPEIQEFITIRDPLKGDTQRKCLGKGFHHGINITDAFMHAVINNEPWDLIDPHTKQVVESVKARDLWDSILQQRVLTGEPYLLFKDTANRAVHPHLQSQGYTINQSNLCTEIMLHTRPDYSAVCCLSSVNVSKFDDWKDDPEFIYWIMRFLDNVLSLFIGEAPEEMWRARKSAAHERSVGLGQMGLHQYLQSKNIPFETALAVGTSRRIALHIKTLADQASLQLGRERGEAPIMEGTGERFAHKIAIAPNASIGPICGGTSPSIEPFAANAYVQQTLSGSFLVRNPNLEKLWKEKYRLSDERIEDLWQIVTSADGSVQGLDWMDDWDKQVYKTARELDQMWVIEHAAVRQPFIDQGQSVNLFCSSEVSQKTLHQWHKKAWLSGLKSLYYMRAQAASSARVSNASGVTESNTYEETDTGECLSCQG